MHPFRLDGKTILITGASSGIGRAIALQCSYQGANLIITGRNPTRLQQTYKELSGVGHQMITANLIDEDDINSIIEQLPRLDGLVCNAGIVEPLLLQFIEKVDVDNTLNTNAISVIHLVRLLVQHKKFKKESSIVLTSSINGNKCSNIGSSIYAASKAMLTGFMKASALELASKGIRVNTIEPGMIETELFSNSVISIEELEKDKMKYPLKRYGKPEEVAFAAIYLLSDATKWMTGTQLLIDGGYTLQ